MLTLINFSDKKFKKKQKLNSLSGKLFGRIDKIIEYNFDDIDKDFLNRNKETINNSLRGLGSFFWKPYFVEKTLNELNEGDFLIYADSGSIFLKDIKPLLAYMDELKKDILCFQLPLIEKQWTKRDTFVLMNCDSEEYSKSSQILATFFILRKSEDGLFFIREWKDYCCDSRVLSDKPNTMGIENYDGFIEHRHDQSVLSLLCKKYADKVLTIGDISDYGFYPYRYYKKNKNRLFTTDIQYPFKGFILSTRSERTVTYLFKYLIRRLLLIFNIKI
jgi:hypothetical protein